MSLGPFSCLASGLSESGASQLGPLLGPLSHCALLISHCPCLSLSVYLSPALRHCLKPFTVSASPQPLSLSVSTGQESLTKVLAFFPLSLTVPKSIPPLLCVSQLVSLGFPRLSLSLSRWVCLSPASDLPLPWPPQASLWVSNLDSVALPPPPLTSSPSGPDQVPQSLGVVSRVRSPGSPPPVPVAPHCPRHLSPLPVSFLSPPQTTKATTMLQEATMTSSHTAPHRRRSPRLTPASWPPRGPARRRWARWSHRSPGRTPPTTPGSPI